MHVSYGGEMLKSRSKLLWQVRLWDENDLPGEWSEEAFFELGLLNPSDWQAKWIAGNYKVNKKQRYPVDCFRKSFRAENVKKGRLYITACGLYEAKLNGEKVGGFVLAPGITDYRKRVQYQTYDVTDLLQEGKNTLTVQLADGWYRGSCGAWGIRNQYGTETKLLARLEITHADGSAQSVVTDGSWDWSNDGPIRFADNQDGEVVEASKLPSYSGKAKITSHHVVPTASNNVPVTEHERLTPKLITTPSGKTVLDYGQNIAGYAEFTVNAKTGQRIFLRFGELLDENGEFTQKNIQCANKKVTTPLQQVEYLCKEGENRYKTTFAIFGFQYILVETDADFKPENFTAIAVYSDMERTGWFESSNELLDKLVDCTLWSAKNNHADLPTDCPTRERHGWTGDTQIFFKTASYLFNYAPMARKYLHDVYDWQEKNGRLPHIVPDGGADFYMRSMNGSVGWSDVGILIPKRYAEIFADESILREFYDGMAAYARFMERRCGKRMPVFAKRIRLPGEAQKYFVNRGQSYGEWAEPVEAGGGFRWTDFVAPHPEVSTAYTCHVLGLMADIAQQLGRGEDAREFRRYHDGCRNAYQQLVRTEDFKLDTDRQARLVRPLYFDLLDGEQKAYAQKRLIEALEHFGWRLGTGFLSTPLILYVLADYDLDAAYRLLENEEIPGWLSMPKQGATTIWESWEGPNAQGGVASLNHYSKGAVVEWLFSTMCGVRVDGENHFIIAPHPGGHFTYAKASYDSVYGRVESGWEKNGESYTLTVRIPCNTTAELILPSGDHGVLSAGIHQFTWEGSRGAQ
ncbi:MAG: family 78 glycoside hydrolase catalytic domain [Oscillospiraceae bacterium]|nr:family 78 glycoside hydrolase catalytic domain [Oscillospiraceae bacterium]